jgi:hypothetical protein
MNRRKIVISFDMDGKIKMEAEGYPDGSCKVAISKLQTLLGLGAPIDTMDKPEAFIESYEGYETQHL